jgi:hypothetical protein
LPEIAMWNPKSLIRSWKWSNIVERQKACNGQLVARSISASSRAPIAMVKFLGRWPSEQRTAGGGKCFPDRGFNGLRTSFHLAHQHRALSSGDTEVSEPILVSVCRQSALCLFPDEKGSQLILHDLEDMAEVLPDEFVLVRHSIAASSKWTAPRHAKSFATRCARRTAVRDPPKSQLHN